LPCRHTRAEEITQLAEKETAMNIETVELQAIAEITKTDEIVEVLSLSLDDLDLVAGGSSLGMID
jgi:hypothetical protein